MASKRAVKLGVFGEVVRSNVAHYRQMSGLTAQQLTERVSSAAKPLGRNAVSEIERGDRRVDVDDLIALAAGLDVSPVQLLLPALGEDVEVPGQGLVSASHFATWLRHGAPLRLDDEGIERARLELEELAGAMARATDRLDEHEEMAAALTDAIAAVSSKPEVDAERLEMLHDMRESKLHTARAQREKVSDYESRMLGLRRAIEESSHGDD